MATEGGLLWVHTKGLAQINGQYGFVDVPDGTVYQALIASGDAQHPNDGALALKYRDGEDPNELLHPHVTQPVVQPTVQQPDPNAGTGATGATGDTGATAGSGTT